MNGRKPRIVRPRRLRRQEDTDVRSRQADFSDAESVRVLDAAADALVGVVARQAARQCFAEWLASPGIRR
jgi:hypothetical protein